MSRKSTDTMSNRPRALIAGASSGLGEAFAKRLASQGYDLVLIARRRERLEGLALQLEPLHGVQVEVIAADLATDLGRDAAISEIEAGPALALLVYCAGFGTRKLVVDLPPEMLAAQVRLQVLSPVALVRAALPAMVEAGRGGVILASSLASFMTTSRYTTYSATKAFLNTFCQGLAVELKDTGVAIQSLCPGLTRTEFFDAPDQEGFDYPQVPDWVWMSSEAVVDESLAALAPGRVIVVPGKLNKVAATFMRSPVVGAMINWLTARSQNPNDEDRPW
jgi:hypothetical protein